MLSSLSLFVATPQQVIASRERTSVEWGRGLTLEEYLERDAIGEGEEFGRDGKLITWVLAPRDDPTTLDFFCSCETFKRQVAVAYPSKPGAKLELGFGYGIASVFTAPQYRGKGYARHMMRLLHWVLAGEQYLSTKTFPENEWGARPGRVPGVGDGVASVLWSDVGPRLYSECGTGIGDGSEDGWVVRDPISTVWKMGEGALHQESGEEELEVLWLDEKMAEEMWSKDGESIQAEIMQGAAEENKIQLSFLPGEGVSAFQWFRLHYHFSRYVEDAPKFCGVRIGQSMSYATWTFEYRPGSPKTLIVTRLRADESTVRRLVQTVLRYAERYGMEEVEMWNLAAAAAAAEVGGILVQREEHLPAIKWYGPQSPAAVEWRNNERFCWC